MRTVEFKQWLMGQLDNIKPITDCASRCKTVERALGCDLDDEFRKDRGESVLSLLRYSAKDERSGKKAPEGFSFREGARVRFRLTDLRSATRKYFVFCESKAAAKRG